VEEHLTDDARRALQLAREEAQGLNHYWLGTEHLLLGLVRMVAEGSTAPGVEALRRLLRHTNEETIRARVTAAVGPIPEAITDGVSLTPRMNRILEQARKLAEENGRDRAGTEYLLLGMFREGGGVGDLVLSELGITYREVCRQLIWLGTLSGPLDPNDMNRTYQKRRYGERVIIAKDQLSVVLQRLPELLPPGASFAFNRLDEHRSYVRISEGLNGAEYVRRALERGPIN
jgi:ATP-dependent Clp protease ATP-binding subunit ClpA